MPPATTRTRTRTRGHSSPSLLWLGFLFASCAVMYTQNIFGVQRLTKALGRSQERKPTVKASGGGQHLPSNTFDDEYKTSPNHDLLMIWTELYCNATIHPSVSGEKGRNNPQSILTKSILKKFLLLLLLLIGVVLTLLILPLSLRSAAVSDAFSCFGNARCGKVHELYNVLFQQS